MAAPPPPTPAPEDRHGRILAELAGMGLELARDLRDRALAAETPEQATQLARAFHTVSRGVRQSLALELKVARFRAELEREQRVAAQAEAAAREPHVARRREAIGRRVEQLIYTEHEGYDFEEAEAERLQWALSDWMSVASTRPDFTTADLDAQILEACETLRLDPARFAIIDASEPVAWRPGMDEGDDDPEDEDDLEDDLDEDDDTGVRHPALADTS